MSHPLTPLILGFTAWSAGVLLFQWLIRRLIADGPGETWQDFFAWHAVRIFARVVHRVRYEGLEHVPATNHPGPLIVVANHTGSVDPMLLQVGCLFNIRWMMATETMAPSVAWLWKWRKTIAVDRDGKDLAAAREAIRLIKSGGCVGVFPEGRIVTPPGRVWPFAEGVGLMVSRTKAPVLLAWIRGTPLTTDMKESIFTPSHAVVRFLGVIQFPDEAKASEITQTLRTRIAEASGWPMTDREGHPDAPAAVG